MQVLVLASGSQYRSQLLRRLGLPFVQCSPDIDETPQTGELPDALAQRLAQEKAQAESVTLCAANASEAAIVIASDQVAACDKQLLGKPGSIDRAQAQLQAMSGRSVTFYTSLHLQCLSAAPAFTALDITTVRFRELSAAEIERYIAADDPLDCAGSFKAEALGISLFEAIDSSDPTALVGLPMIALCRGLRQLGVAIP